MRSPPIGRKRLRKKLRRYYALPPVIIRWLSTQRKTCQPAKIARQPALTLFVKERLLHQRHRLYHTFSATQAG
jgi:hypothetical protein